MAMQFEYDEKGGTFYYFLLSFMALVLIPGTYYLWPRSTKKDSNKKDGYECNCGPCNTKKHRLTQSLPFKNLKRISLKIAIIIAWIIFGLVAYKTSQVEMDWKEFDPYFELGLDRDATTSEIKKAYRRLSLVYHPDKETGDSNKFMRISKAHQALTDEEAMENWKNYGNPDGPGATHFGIALPKWIVEKQNSVWVLGAYGLVFLILLPTAVGSWWYRSIKFSSEQILMDTARLYNIFIQKTPNMILKRIVMILGASFEFDKGHNNDIVERPSDNEDLPRVMKYLPNLGEKNKERPLCFHFSIKARALLHAHFQRLDTLKPHLEEDKSYILKKCPYLLNEMISIAAQHVALSHAGKARMPRLNTIESMMKISQMIIQALWEKSNPLLQLPHLTDDILKHFVTKKRHIRSIDRFARLNDEERRALLRTLKDSEYQDVMNVCRTMPLISMVAKPEVKDDEDNNTITAGSIVTVTVVLTRRDMSSIMDNDGEMDDTKAAEDEAEHSEQGEDAEESQVANSENAQKKPKIWEKQKKKTKGKPRKKGSKAPAKKTAVLVPVTSNSVTKEAGEDSNQSTPKRSKAKDEEDDGSEEGSEDEREDSEAEAADEDKPESDSANGDFQDEEVWEEMQRDLRKENKLETKSKETHLVHAPYFPDEKYEWWWLYVADKKNLSLISAPIHVCSLKDTEEIQLKFSAPHKTGNYTYAVILRSDSYVDFDIFENIKLDVREPKKIENVKQWDFSDDEADKDDLSDSDETTDTDDDDD